MSDLPMWEYRAARPENRGEVITMPKLSKEERAELEARLAEDDDDDESDEVTVGRPDGTSFKGTFRRARQLGYVVLPEPKADPKAKGEGGEVKRFTGGRRTG